MKPLTAKQIWLLKTAIDEWETWRGAIVGNPDTTALETFDLRIKEARIALRDLCAQQKEIRQNAV